VKIIVIGATGTIGKAVAHALSGGHQVIGASRSSGDHRVDIVSQESLKKLFAALAPFDAVICAAGQAKFGPFESLPDADLEFSLSNKLMGQVNVLRCGLPHMSGNGSFTLTSGVLANEPMPGSAAISMANAGLEGFARAAALELPRGIRVNVVSPPWVSETLKAMGRDPKGGVPAAAVARAYVDSVEGTSTGKIIDARTYKT
jgi:NAD(P)-dependent dehydrogenase (short-subunit alcohol dehydrogenase family)